MSPLLVIDAATYRGTIAVVDGAVVRAAAEVQMRGADAERLMPAVSTTLQSAGVELVEIAGIVCGGGPGSFTSLRIAASIGKGLAAASGIPLFHVSSVLLVIAGAEPAMAVGRYLAVLDAMRGDVFAGRVSVAADGTVELEGEVQLLDASTATRAAEREGRTLAGPTCGVELWPHARGVARVGIETGAIVPADLAAWEPSYGRLAEAQVKWEREHGRSLPS